MSEANRRSDHLLMEQDGKVCRLTLNRPDKRNALTPGLLFDLYEAVEMAAAHRGTSVVVIRGSGSCFSAGFDLNAGHRAPSVADDDQAVHRSAMEMNRIWQCPIPIIAQVHGWCLATATDLAFSCDVVIAANDAKIGHPGVRAQGTPPSNMWLYHAGPQLAKWLLLTGGHIDGAEAARRGLVLSSHDEADLDDAVAHVAGEMSLVSREISMVNKAVLNYGIDLMGRSQLQRFASAQNAIGHASADNQAFRGRIAEAGLAAALEERDAAFAPTTRRDEP